MRLGNKLPPRSSQKEKSIVNGETTLFVGGRYEINDTMGEVSKYYFAGASRIAVRKYIVPQTTTLTYLLGDHLGSTSLVVNACWTSSLRAGFNRRYIGTQNEPT